MACTSMSTVSQTARCSNNLGETIRPPPGLEHLKVAAHVDFAQDAPWQAHMQQLRQAIHLQLSSVKVEESNYHHAVEKTFWDGSPLGRSLEKHGSGTPTTAPASSADSDSASTSSDEQFVAKQIHMITPAFSRQLTVERSNDSHRVRVCWSVDARKLRGMDKQILSSTFDICQGVPCKLMIKPRIAKDKKGQANFKAARGIGFIELKCDADATVLLPTVAFKLSIGDGSQQQSLRGPVVHDFANSSVGRLPHNAAEWQWSAAINSDTMTLPVCLDLEIMY